MNKLVIIGASGHGKVVADLAEKNGYTDIIFLDDNPEVKSCGKYEVVGGCAAASSYKEADFVVAIGNGKIRRKIQTELVNKGLTVVSLIHPAAVIATDVKIGKGTVVVAGVVVNSCTEIGEGCIINTCASIDHDCTVGDFCHISVGSHLCGTVSCGNDVWIGAGSTVSNNVSICKECMIGAGSLVVKNIENSGTYIGAPVRMLK